MDRLLASYGSMSSQALEDAGSMGHATSLMVAILKNLLLISADQLEYVPACRIYV